MCPLHVGSEAEGFTQWDTFRALYALLSLHDPLNFARIVRGMINIQQHEGELSLAVGGRRAAQANDIYFLCYRVASRVSWLSHSAVRPGR